MAQEILTSITVEALEGLLDDLGFVTKSVREEEVAFVLFNLRDLKARVCLYGEGPAYDNLQFGLAFEESVPLEQLNAWNRDMRFLKAYLLEEGGTGLEMDLDLEGGVTKEAIVGAFQLFATMLDLWLDKQVEAQG